MNKSELVLSVVEKTNLTKKDSEKAVNAVFQSIEEGLVNNDKIQLFGFGTFEIRERAERTGRNPKNGEPLTIPASRLPAFKPGKMLKERFNQ